MKRHVVLFFSFLLLMVQILSVNVTADRVSGTVRTVSTIDIDVSQVEQGIVHVLYNTGFEGKVKFLVQNGSDHHYYDLTTNKDYTSFPLQYSDGAYTFRVFENVSGTSYRSVKTVQADVVIEDELAVFLHSVQEVYFTEEHEAIQLAERLVSERLTQKNRGIRLSRKVSTLSDREIFDVLHNYVINTLEYDYDKIKTLSSDYVPQIDQVLEDAGGICYDYSVLLAAMLRSQGVATKLVKGYADFTDVYHAWNEVYFADEDKWIVVDATYDAFYLQNALAFSVEKPEEAYRASKVF